MKAQSLIPTLVSNGWELDPDTNILTSPDALSTIEFVDDRVVWNDTWTTHLHHFETWSQFIEWVNELRDTELPE